MAKKENYKSIISMIKDTKKENPLLPDISLYAEIVNLLSQANPLINWVGFYLADLEKERLYLGPYIGPLPCEYIPFTKGVCGKAYSERKTQNVPDVRKLAYHIACSSETLSEIVVPVIKKDSCVAVLDIDSNFLSAFDELDEEYLTEIISLLEK
ncbi:MAG: GAF domain-containing protein [Bacilli bacterium]